MRGEAVKIAECPDHLPIGLLKHSVLKRALEPGQIVTFDDVELTPSRALDIVLQQHREAIHRQLLETQLSESAWNASADLAPVALPKAVGAVLS